MGTRTGGPASSSSGSTALTGGGSSSSSGTGTGVPSAPPFTPEQLEWLDTHWPHSRTTIPAGAGHSSSSASSRTPASNSGEFNSHDIHSSTYATNKKFTIISLYLQRQVGADTHSILSLLPATASRGQTTYGHDGQHRHMHARGQICIHPHTHIHAHIQAHPHTYHSHTYMYTELDPQAEAYV